jgi:putative endonuclease
VLARNFRTRAGEIDIIVRRGDQVAFVEVKSWQSVPREDLAHSIGPRKRGRIARAARLFLGRRPDLAGAHLRFDVVFLGGEEHGIEHIAGAFNEEGID